MNVFLTPFCLLAIFISGLRHVSQEQKAIYQNHARIDTSSVRIKEITFSEGVKEEFVYDEKGNIGEIKCHQSRTSQESRDYSYRIRYDKRNQIDIIETTNRLVPRKYAYIYDKKKRIDLIICFMNGMKYCSISYSYNDKGQVKGKSFLFEQKRRFDYESGVRYEYDSSGNVSKATKLYAINNNDLLGRRFVNEYEIYYSYHNTTSLIKQIPVLEFLQPLNEIERDEFIGEERFRTNIAYRKSLNIRASNQSPLVRREELYSYKNQMGSQNLPEFFERTDGKSYTSSYRITYY